MRQLFRIAHIGAQAQRRAARLFDLQFGQIEFGLTARQQPHSRTLGRESHSQAFADAAARPGDQNALPFDGVQESVLYFRGKGAGQHPPPRFICTKMRYVPGFGKSVRKGHLGG